MPNEAKLMVTKEVAEAIEEMERNYISVGLTLKFHATHGLTGKYAPMQTLDIEDLAKALIVGYTVEKSPEDKVREYYNRCRANRVEAEVNGRTHRATHWDGQAIGASITLDILGISVKGVNA